MLLIVVQHHSTQLLAYRHFCLRSQHHNWCGGDHHYDMINEHRVDHQESQGKCHVYPRLPKPVGKPDYLYESI